MKNKLYYTWEQYNSDIKHIVDNYEFDSIVALYRGSLPIAVHLSNITDATMSVIKYQSYGKDQKQSQDTKAPEWIVKGMIRPKKVLVIDDIYDTGSTIRQCKEFIGHVPDWDVTYLTIFGKKNDDGVKYLRRSNGKWIVFPWETTTGPKEKTLSRDQWLDIQP
jgi:hypoxanthine phosphoribosyltransferase